MANKLDGNARPPQFRVLTREILVVGARTHFGFWKAWIGVVPGKCHDDEWQKVLQTGDRLDEELARFLFPDFNDLIYDR